MRIGIDILNPWGLSGQQRYLWRLGSWLGGRGHEVHFLCTKKSPGDQPPPAGCRIHPLHGASPPQLRKHLRALSLDVLMINPERARGYGGIRANVLRPGYGTDQYRQKLRSFRNPWERGLRAALRRSPPVIMDRRRERGFYRNRGVEPEVIAISEYMGREIRASYGVDPRRIHLVYNGIDLSEFSPQRRAQLREECRRAWGIPQDVYCVLTMAHNFRLKGVWGALEQVRRVRAAGTDVHLLVAGKGTGEGQRRKAVALAARFGISDSVHLVGTVVPAARAFAAADVLLFPSWHDAFGFVILEAMACGLPVITTPYAGASEVMEDGVSGFIVDPEDRDMTTGRLLQLAAPGLRAEMGAKARASAEDHGEESNFQQMEEIFIGVAERRPETRGAL